MDCSCADFDIHLGAFGYDFNALDSHAEQGELSVALKNLLCVKPGLYILTDSLILDDIASNRRFIPERQLFCIRALSVIHLTF